MYEKRWLGGIVLLALAGAFILGGRWTAAGTTQTDVRTALSFYVELKGERKELWAAEKMLQRRFVITDLLLYENDGPAGRVYIEQGGVVIACVDPQLKSVNLTSGLLVLPSAPATARCEGGSVDLTISGYVY